ncbi:2Fe-2S iron-sulfur cluster-binding protein [Alkalihalobacillus sp. AL-G]|uniref:2Fe-2S iron-sulfur cluster-binding protein n=1 Tax=Alkalihalobacillus sp. AL-G TaxID=2926399 RepID=UPI00272DC1A1|nr:2Fe-2S iron-sulfur cluster-binding protein [Alkalihalobacillus sp. AL-G]WLD91962.1 (2Fe-2S)-binding protein [Alkalihalobacillus sp. AL-G]
MKKALTVGSLKQNAIVEVSKEVSGAANTSEATIKNTTTTEKIYFIQNRRSCTIPFKKWSTVLDTALANGCQLDFKCKKGICGKCEIHVLKGMDRLTSPNGVEQKNLGSNLHSGHRLSCQARMK